MKTFEIIFCCVAVFCLFAACFLRTPLGEPAHHHFFTAALTAVAALAIHSERVKEERHER